MWVHSLRRLVLVGLAVMCVLAVQNYSTIWPNTVINSTVKTGDTKRSFASLPPDQNNETRRHAYTFLMAGCNPEKDKSYMGYVYNIMVAIRLFRLYGSKRDIVVMVRMHSSSTLTSLPSEVEELLEKSGVLIWYIPKVKTDNFYTAMMDKFRVLQMDAYSRVIFLDSDTIPLCSLDYLFDRSEGPNALLQENLVTAITIQPAQGGIFMLRPNQSDYDEIQKIIQRREEQGNNFDVVNGWGHRIIPPDEWVSSRGRGTNWTFYGAIADQGLLYHWVKYEKKRVTIVQGNKLETWRGNATHVRKVNETTNTLEKECHGRYYYHYHTNNRAPYDHIHHFTGKRKPWMSGAAFPPDVANYTLASSPNVLWFHIFRQIVSEYNLTVDSEHFHLGRPSLGLWPTHTQVQAVKESKDTNRAENSTNPSSFDSRFMQPKKQKTSR